MGKVALITGVRRIGRFIAEALAEKGYNLAVVYRSSEEEVRKLEKTVKEKGSDILTLRADLTQISACREIVYRTLAEFGRVDAFIHLASPYEKTPIDSMTEEDLRRHMGPIAEAFLFISLEIYKAMMRNEGEVKGRIIAFGDWAVDHTPYRGYTAYFVAKGALHTAVRVLAKEFAPYVLVNCIALGPTLKPEDLDVKDWEKILKSTPLRREVPVEDVVSLVIYLLEVCSMTGEIIKLDSGRHVAGSGTGSLV